MKKRILFSLLFISLFLSYFVNNKISYAQDNRYYEINVTKNINISKAQNMLKEGNIDGALEIYQTILEENPDSIPARLGVAGIYSDLYKIKASQREFNKVLNKDPFNSTAHNGLGLTYYRMTTSSNMEIRENTGTLYRKAIQEFQKAISADPNNDEAIANLGMIYHHQGRIGDAEQKYREALAINPLNSNANYRLGTILYEKGDTNTAISYYKKSLEINSKNSSAHYHLGEALVSTGQYSEAIEELSTALYLNPNSAPVHEKLGEAYKHQGNETAAIESFKKSIAIKPEDTLPYLLLSSVYEDRDDHELAIAELKSALKNNPDFSEAKLKIASMSLDLGKVDQAVEYYKKTLIDDPGNPDAEKGLSKAYFRKVQNDVASGIVASPARLLEAEKFINKAIVNDPEDLELHLAKYKVEKLSNKPEATNEELLAISEIIPANLPQSLDKGYALFKLGEFKQSDNLFRGIENQLTKKDDLLLLAETLVEYKDFNIAEEVFQNVLSQDGKNVQAQRGLEKIKVSRNEALENYRLGWDLFNKGQRQSALDQFNKSKTQDPTFEKSYYWAGEVYKKNDNFQSALENYETFLKLTDDEKLIKADKDLAKRRNNAEKAVKKFSKKVEKE